MAAICPSTPRRVRNAFGPSIAFVAMALVAPAAFAALPPPPAGVTTFTRAGIEFSAIGPTPAFNAPNTLNNGRGRNDTAYALARTELTAAQWVEFANAFSMQSAQLSFFIGGGSAPTAIIDNTYFGPGFRWRVAPTGGRFGNNPGGAPVQGFTLAMAAFYCNWLHNGKTSNFEANLRGAYNLSMSVNEGNNITLKVTSTARSPDARYWIPTLDQWFAAGWYDPNKNGPGSGGYWDYLNRSNSPLKRGFPGDPGAQTSTANWLFEGERALFQGVASYPDQQTAFGLFDMSGGAREWTETIDPIFGFNWRYQMGTDVFTSVADTPYGDRDFIDGPLFFNLDGSSAGLRLATTIPTPGVGAWLALSVAILRHRRRH
jgi:sulfatase modifying factor 1